MIQLATERAGRCYQLAWRYLVKHDEGEMVHGSVLSAGRRINHAWIDLPSGFTYEPVSETYADTDGFYKTYSAEVHQRYTPTQAAILAAKTNTFGPWDISQEMSPQTAPSEQELTYVIEKWRRAKARNSTLAGNDLSILEKKGYDVDEAKEALDEYKSIERGDYDDAEEFSEARSEAWDAFVDALDSIEPPDNEFSQEMSPQTDKDIERIRQDFCLKFGAFNPRHHACIRQIESLNETCLRCKQLWMQSHRMPQTLSPLLEPLAAEARKYETFDAFQDAFLREIKHGMYYHVTSDPNFQIRPEAGPRDMSSMAMGGMEPGKLMLTSHLELWAEEYAGTRKYVAVIDMSLVPKEAYWQVNRGFGNEFYVNDPSKARVVKVIPIKQALKESEEYQDILESTIRGSDDLKRFYEQVRGDPGSPYQQEGEEIARQLGNGVIYNGPQMNKGKLYAHLFTDVAVTGTTFACHNLEDCKQRLIKKREEFGAEPPSLSPKVIKRYPTEPITVEVGTAKVSGQFTQVEGEIEPSIVVTVHKPIGAVQSGSQEDIDLQKAVDELEQTLRNRIQEVYQNEVPQRGEPVKDTSPTVLTMGDYNENWKPLGWNIIFIGPTSTWRQEWGEWEAIRDIVQNALDEAETYKWGFDDQGLWISDKGKGVGVADFLLGPPKLKSDYARGKFGEGMKIAGLALVREGYPVHIMTVGRELWIIFLEQDVNGKAKSLAALWRPGGTTEGTTWHIIGYDGKAYSDRFSVNLPKAAIKAQVPAPITEPVQRYNQLIEYDFPEGSRIYARDIYLKSIRSRFSYNLWGFPLAPDRHAPAREADMYTDMGRLWAGIKKVELLEHFFKMMRDPPDIDSQESHQISMGSYGMGTNPVTESNYSQLLKKNQQYWKEAWANCFGENAVMRTNERWDALVKHLGYYSVGLYYAITDTLSEIIKTDDQLMQESQDRLRDVTVISDRDLSPAQRVHLELARAIAREIQGSEQLRGIHAAIIPPASDRVRTAGMYGRDTVEIFISAEQLSVARSAVDTTIHELAHHTAGQSVSNPMEAEDGAEAHTRELTRLAGEVVQLTGRGRFDSIVKEPDFSW